MVSLKEQILLAIYEEFEKWAKEEKTVCSKGCTACCTQNVTMTAVEGDLIHRHIRENDQMEWFAGKLQEKGNTRRPEMTTNGFAAACLQGEDVESGSSGNESVCPFLENKSCSIYAVRPFSCRCFVSEETCKPGVAAVIPESYLSASTAVMQIVEHLGQGEYWGNMLDVLLALSDLPENRRYNQFLPASLPDQGRANLVKALPLPGFLLLEEEMKKIEPLIQGIFTHPIGEKSIEEILNNR
ncbi:MAG: YkgJ family cysteine cluster protein [Proteobacteria bacterium]|nr:YkgJ family cysteine cluster protein [Pseudomonadota bacterium]